MKMRSIQRRLIGAVLLIEFLSALVLTGVVFLHERETVFHAFDIMLRGRTDSILGAVQDAEDAGDNVILDLADVHSPRMDQYRVQDSSGRLLGSTPLADQLSAPASAPSGTIFMTRLHHRLYRVLVLDGSRKIDADEPGGGVTRYVRILYAAPIRRVWHLILHTVLFYAFSSLLVMAATALGLLWTLRRALQPLDGLALGAANVSAGAWALVVPEQARQTTELQPLVAAIERSLAGIESAFRKQQQFVGDAAHELKTAVAVVKSSLQLVTLRTRTPAEYKSGLERCQEDIQRLEELVRQMLTLAHAESQNSPADSSEDSVTDLMQAAQAVVARLTPMATLRQVSLVLAGDEARIPVDTAQAITMMENLLCNAIQYSRPDGKVYVAIHPRDEHVYVTVQDEGQGISPEDREHIFDRFWRGDPSRSRLTGGYGLGLAIVKAIVEKAHGEITVHSQLNLGTTVEMRLPLATKPASRDHAETLNIPSS